MKWRSMSIGTFDAFLPDFQIHSTIRRMVHFCKGLCNNAFALLSTIYLKSVSVKLNGQYECSVGQNLPCPMDYRGHIRRKLAQKLHVSFDPAARVSAEGSATHCRPGTVTTGMERPALGKRVGNVDGSPALPWAELAVCLRPETVVLGFHTILLCVPLAA